MKVLKGREKLSAVKATTVFIELFFALERRKSSPPLTNLHRDKARMGHAREHEIPLLLRLEARICIRKIGHSRALGCETVSKSALLSQIRI
jgi:hypothetical protein